LTVQQELTGRANEEKTMVDVYPDKEGEDHPIELEADAAPDRIGVYDRPEGNGAKGLNVTMLLVIFVLLIIAYFVLISVL
jgi:hypothetical protein